MALRVRRGERGANVVSAALTAWREEHGAKRADAVQRACGAKHAALNVRFEAVDARGRPGKRVARCDERYTTSAVKRGRPDVPGRATRFNASQIVRCEERAAKSTV